MDRAADHDVARSAITKASWRILPLLGLGYLVAYVDRVNISFAAFQMNEDLAFSATVYGLGGGLFFLSYAIFEVPSNLLLARFGARRWISRIMITWGLLAAGMMFVQTPVQFYVMRFLLGMAEAGFFPGVIYYLAQWYPKAHRGRAISRFYVSGPIAAIVMGGISGALLDLDGLAGLQGWQWLFLVQGLPAVLIGLLTLLLLPDAPAAARWLTAAEKDWLQRELARDAAQLGEPAGHDVLAVLRNPLVQRLAVVGFLTIGVIMTFNLSAPLLLKSGTSLDVTGVGYIVSFGGVLGAIGMIFCGWYSDRRNDRFPTLLGSTVLMGVSLLTLAVSTSPAAIVLAYLVVVPALMCATLSGVMVWPDVLPVRQLAVGGAAINTVSQVGAFLGPLAWGGARDGTGSFHAGLMGLSVASLLAAVVILVLRRRVRGALQLQLPVGQRSAS